MTKLRVVLCERVVLKRYYCPALIDLSAIKKMLPDLPEESQLAIDYLKENPSRLQEFLSWYYPDESKIVEDPTGKGRSNPESTFLEEVSLHEEEDASWEGLFDTFSSITPDTLQSFCEEHSYTFDALEEESSDSEVTSQASSTPDRLKLSL